VISDDEYLERIVAGIHAVTTTGADVSWNEVINDRQFDVVVRFKLGSLRYLVLIEVKNRTRKSTASDMDGFVLKARDQNANKAVFVTAAGFQSGAITVAKRHGVDLFTVTFDDTELHLSAEANFVILSRKDAPDLKDVPPTVRIGEPTLVANIEKVTLVYADGQRFEMPDEQSQMNYYAKKTTLDDGQTLDDVIRQSPLGAIALDETCSHEIHLDSPQRIMPPDDYIFPSGLLTSLECVVTGRQGRPLRGDTLIDPGALSSPVNYTNVITGETSRYVLDQLPLGAQRVSVGDFYFIPHPLMYYYCAAIEGEEVSWYLIESFQNGEKVSGAFTQKIKYSPYYIPVSDNKILARLRRRLDDYLNASGQTKG